MVQIRPEEVMTGLDNYRHKHGYDVPQPSLGDYLQLVKALEEAGVKVVEKQSIKKWREP